MNNSGKNTSSNSTFTLSPHHTKLTLDCLTRDRNYFSQKDGKLSRRARKVRLQFRDAVNNNLAHIAILDWAELNEDTQKTFSLVDYFPDAETRALFFEKNKNQESPLCWAHKLTPALLPEFRKHLPALQWVKEILDPQTSDWNLSNITTDKPTINALIQSIQKRPLTLHPKHPFRPLDSLNLSGATMDQSLIHRFADTLLQAELQIRSLCLDEVPIGSKGTVNLFSKSAIQKLSEWIIDIRYLQELRLNEAGLTNVDALHLTDALCLLVDYPLIHFEADNNNALSKEEQAVLSQISKYKEAYRKYTDRIKVRKISDGADEKDVYFYFGESLSESTWFKTHTYFSQDLTLQQDYHRLFSHTTFRKAWEAYLEKNLVLLSGNDPNVAQWKEKKYDENTLPRLHLRSSGTWRCGK